jgi:biotin-dependent carboxylase-like uncharacterized protein
MITIQDLGRAGHMHEAVPPSGALVRERLIGANRAVHNPDDAPALEVLGEVTIRVDAIEGIEEIEEIETVNVASDTIAVRAMGIGEEMTVASAPRRVAYLAVRGGFAAPRVLGGRGALLSAGLGELVRTGHALTTAGLARVAPPRMAAGAASAPAAVDADADRPIRLMPGPDLHAFTADALDVLTSSPYRIQPTSDRVGTRLTGPAIPRSAAPEVTRPMVIGALEVPRDGQPIVLGPEHPTTGGYPIVAVVASADLGRLFSIPLGGTVRFCF